MLDLQNQWVLRLKDNTWKSVFLLYSQFFLHIGGELHITRVHETFENLEGNQIVTCIPEFMRENAVMLFEKFHKVKNEYHEIDENNKYAMTFEVYKRKSFPGSDFNYTC